MKKRLFSLLLVLTMVASMLPLSVWGVSAAGVAIPNLHRGVLANCEDTDCVYWDEVAETDFYYVQIYRDGVFVTDDHVWYYQDRECSISGRDKWIVENMLWFYKAGTYTVKVTAYEEHGDQNMIRASSEISFDVKKEEQVATNWAWETDRTPVNVKSGENVKFTVGEYSGGQSLAITKSILDKAKCELAYVKGVDWLSATWNEDDELELVGTVPKNCPKGNYTVYVGFKSKNGNNTGFVFERDVKVSANTYVSQMLINTPHFIPTYWEIYKPEDARLEYSYPRLTVNKDGKSFIADWAGDTDGLRWDDYVDNLREFKYDRCFSVNLFRVTDAGERIDVTNSEHTFIEGMYEYVWTIPLQDFDPDGNEVMYADDLKVYLGNYSTEVDKIERVDNSNDKLKVYKYYYVYKNESEINSVTVNGTSVADGGAVTANNRNVTIKTNYDSKLSDALKDYGCSMNLYAAYYLNGAKINVAMITPVDNGDGTATKSYTRTLNPGDELRVESWLEVKWPDGSTDRMDEHTVTVSRPSVSFDFANQNPVGSADETIGLTANSGDTKSYTFGSTAVPSGYYVEKKATLKGLFAGLDADQTVTVKDGTATLTHTFIKPGLYQLTETLNLYENGSTKVIATKSHKFLIEVAAADPAFIVQPHYDGKGMQTGTNYVSWKLNFTPVKLIARCNLGTYARPNWKEYELDPTKSFAALVAYSQKYVLYAYYGEGARDYVASDAFSAEKPADFTPAFTKQPVGDQSLGGNPVEVTWATNFVPVKISIMQGTGVKPTMEHSVLDDATATSTLLGASENNYFICAYYSDTEYVTSNKFKITELAPAFTLQPANGVSLGGAYAETTWATNFTPVKLALVKINYSSNGRPFYTYEELDVNATYCTVQPGYEEYCIRAYFNDTQYVSSNKFIVTEMNYYNAWFYVDDTVLDKVMVLEGDYVARPADPVKDGYTFLGWYTDDDELYNFAAPVTDDVHLTAWFEQITYYVVKFMVDDSEWYSCAVNEGESVSAPTVPEKDGYKFLGWSYEGAYYDFAAPVTGDMTLYAEYEKIVTGHDVIFHLGTDPVASQEVQDGDTAIEPEAPAQEGKVFLGWYTAPEGGEKFDFSTPITGDLNLYARFEKVATSLPGDLNGDGAVNNRDLALLQQYINKWDVTINLDAADVNDDGAVNNRDLALMQQYINKWDVVLK